MSYQRIRVSISEHIGEIIINRPEQLNAADPLFFEELKACLKTVEQDNNIRVILLWAEGRVFTAGTDLKQTNFMDHGDGDRATQSLKLYRTIKEYQDIVSSIHNCKKPVIAAIHNLCLGAGVDMVTACDIRLCTCDAKFSVKETQMAIVADLGSIQRLTGIVGRGIAREMVLTGELMDAEWALRTGFVNKVFATKEHLLEGARLLCNKIAANSPLVVQGSKIALNYADEHGIEDSLNQVRLWNSAFLQSDDLVEAISAFMTKRKPIFKSKL